MNNINRRHPGLLYKISFLFAFVATFTFLALKAPQDSQAASLANFRPGNIISDYTMSNYATMSVDDINTFLHAHGNCNDTNITKASWYPSLHYHIENGHFICLADERFATSGANYGDLLKEDEASQTAAEIIYEVSQKYKINPQVFLVLLEKEQGLISDSWPNSIQYRSATGFGCPDTAPCDSEYYGLKNQLESAAWLFRTVLDGGWTNYPLGENYIYYNPNRACGGSIVNIENLATSSLYRYTPYQPNQAALNAGYGTVSCGAYGNRNFYLFFMDWFGDPTITNTPEYEAFLEPRYLEIIEESERIDPFTLEVIDTLPAGMIRKYDSKIHITDGWCYRTEYSTAHEVDACVLAKNVKEIELEYEDVPVAAQEMIIAPGAKKTKMNTATSIMDFSEYIIRNFTKKTSFLGTTYYITEYDANYTDSKYGIAEEYLIDSYEKFTEPKTLVLSSTSNRVNPLTGEVYDTLEKGKILSFTSSIKNVEGNEYYRTEHNTTNRINAAIDKTLLKEISIELYENFVAPRKMRLKEDAKRINPFTGEAYDELSKGRIIKFSTKIYLDGKWYYRTEHNTLNQINAAVPATALEEV